MKPGDLVKVHKDGVSVFTVISIDEEDGTALIESAVDAPGKYLGRPRSAVSYRWSNRRLALRRSRLATAGRTIAFLRGRGPAST